MRTKFRGISTVACLVLCLFATKGAALLQDEKPANTTAATKSEDQKQKAAEEKAAAEKKAAEKKKAEKLSDERLSTRGLSAPKKPGRPAGTPGEKDSTSNEDKPPK